MKDSENARLAVRQGRPFVVQCEHFTTPGSKDAATAQARLESIVAFSKCSGTHKVYDARTGQEVKV